MAGLLALRPESRVSFMGGPRGTGTVDFPYREFVIKKLTLRRTFVYTAAQVKELIRMVETRRFEPRRPSWCQMYGNLGARAVD